MSKKQQILDAVDRGQLATALRLIAEGIDEGDNAAVSAAAAAAQASANTALSQNTTEGAELADHESRIAALE